MATRLLHARPTAVWRRTDEVQNEPTNNGEQSQQPQSQGQHADHRVDPGGAPNATKDALVEFNEGIGFFDVYGK